MRGGWRSGTACRALERSEGRGMRQPQPRDVSEANEQPGRSSRSGRAVGYPPPLGRAEQRSSVRMKALALFERSEFASAPNAASSARHREAARTWLAFFLVTFFLATQKKVTRLPGRNPACHRSKVTAAQQTPSLLPQGNHKGCPYTLTPHSSLLTPHSSPPAAMKDKSITFSVDVNGRFPGCHQ